MKEMKSFLIYKDVTNCFKWFSRESSSYKTVSHANILTPSLVACLKCAHHYI